MSRRVYMFRPDHPLASANGMVEVVYLDPDEVELALAGPKHVAIVGDSHHDGVRSPIDGADISSKTKRRQYMKDKGLADYDDYQGVWAKAEKRREAVRTGHFDEKERTEAVEKAWWQVTEKGYKPAPERAEVLEQQGAAVVVSDDALAEVKNGPIKLKEHE